MESTILTDYDMVLSLSESTINLLFSTLLQKNIIHQRWNIIITGDDDDKVKEIKFNEENFQDSLQDAITKNELKYALNFEMASPTISIDPDERLIVRLCIPFQKGTLYRFTLRRKIKEIHINNSQYAFKVKLKKIEKNVETTNWITEESKERFEKICQEIGLPQEIFTIESLFLDLENANYADYDKDLTNIPIEDVELKSIFQNLLGNVFGNLAKTKNPYILGYAVKLPKYENQPKALFQPTACRFSTSYRSKQENNTNAINYLMMTKNRSFPEGQQNLNKSLLEKITINNEIDDGVFAIDYELFGKNLIKPLLDAISEGIKLDDSKPELFYDLKKTDFLIKTSSKKREKFNQIASDLLKDTYLYLEKNLTVSGCLKNDSKTKKNLVLECAVDYYVDIKIEPYGIFHGGRYEKYSAKLSTTGQYKEGPEGKKGIPGFIKISIQPDTQGKMEIKIDEFRIPAIGYERENIPSADYDVVAALNNSAAKKEIDKDAENAMNNVKEILNKLKDNLQQKINSLTVNKLILPLGKIYTFNRIQLNEADLGDNTILFTVGYARME
ncbi:hypothetical protein NIES4074_29860 [Cylindrospermum sp. NIES-4074]|nr:hypothetical protein NIES4074_29860 [Cylindrospermum sp. NIES-4074]